MKQVFLSGKGQIEVIDVPVPGKLRNSILVRNAFSVISSGTEGAAVTKHGGVLGLYEKVTQSKDRAGQIWDIVTRLGVEKTWEMVRSKLDDYTMIGYSCAGEVVEVDDAAQQFKIGDHVACMGTGFANHAEYVAIPMNLAVQVPNTVALEQAALGAIAAIAMQGVRRLELTAGERVGVIGLGLIGQLAVRQLAAMGYEVFGIDLSEARAAKAREVPDVVAWSSDVEESVSRIMAQTGGAGLDGIIVCAATSSDAPVNMAFDLCRQRGRVVIVGDVGLGLERKKMYRKEIELRLSCSYGPGRYDDEYELRGRDYPLAFVRWTERRNLEHYLQLLKSRRLDVGSLISARVPVDAASAAYSKVKAAATSTYGVLLDYGKGLEDAPVINRTIVAASQVEATKPVESERIAIAIVGAGGYAKGVHIPNLKKLSDRFEIYGVATRSGGTAGVVARSAGAKVATSDHRALLSDPKVDAVLIATRHESHAGIVLDALAAGKHVFVEKPMAVTVEDASAIVKAVAESRLILRVGFNRRFAPYLIAMRDAIGQGGSRMLFCRVNVGPMGAHWSNTEQEGGRLLGEGVHFFDLCNWFMGVDPVSVTATFSGDPDVTNPNATVHVLYGDGSVAEVLYTTLGHPGLGKEYFEAFGNGRSVRLDDYQRYESHGTRIAVRGNGRGEKGQRAALAEFAAAIRQESSDVRGADARAGLFATRIAVAALESGRSGRSVKFGL